MTRPFPIPSIATALCAGAASLMLAQTPAPPAPPLTQQQKEAAAAIQVPAMRAPPAPGEFQSNPPAKPADAAKPVAPPPVPAPPTPDNSASKLKALEAATQQPGAPVAPRVAPPSDRMPITTSTSSSRQFVVHGKVFETRSAMSSRCDEIAAELRKVLNDREPWVLPIVVVLNTGEDAAKSSGPPIVTTVSELDHGGFHLQVTINERPGLNAANLRMEIVRGLLAERILRNHTKIVTPEGRLLLPDWVMTGVLHAMDYKASARPSALFSTIFHSGKIYGIEEIIAASPVKMDGLSRTIYETSCCALVLALVDQPDGPKRFNRFLNALASDPRSERELLNVAFPNFAASASSLNKWWSLQLATLSKPGIAERFTPAESLKAIEDAITLRYEAPPAEVPQNIKPRPFVLPSPLVVVSDVPKSEPPTADEAIKPKARSDTQTTQSEKPAAATAGDATTASADAEEAPKHKRSLWRRLLFLRDPDEPKPEVQEEPPPATTATVSANTAPLVAGKKVGVLNRLFGGGGTDEKKEKAAEEAEEKATAVEATKTGEQAVQEPVEEKKKRSMLNPLNWFRSSKKDEATPPEEKPAKDSQTSVFPAPTFDAARLLSPALADAWRLLTPHEPRPTIEPLLNFLKRKPKAGDEKKAEPDAKEKTAAPADAKTGTKEEPKAAMKADTKPRTTNPNAKPAAKKSSSAPNAPRTTSPDARPVPVNVNKPATTSSGLVPVSLPLEEYKHVLKRSDHAVILERNIATLRALDLRVSVLFRPVVLAYLAAITDLKDGKTKDMDKRLAVLREFAVVAYQKSIAVRDYLDWFEASESSRLSGKFDDYLNLPALIQQEIPPRADPISKYLDAIDKEFTK